jgi:excisionase family DNA binding protein
MATQRSARTGEKPRKAGNGAGRGSAARSGEKIVPISLTDYPHESEGPVAQSRDASLRISDTWGNRSLLTKQQAASYVGCSPRYLERAIVTGRLRALKPSSKLVRIRLRDLDAFLESGATIGGDV